MTKEVEPITILFVVSMIMIIATIPLLLQTVDALLLSSFDNSLSTSNYLQPQHQPAMNNGPLKMTIEEEDLGLALALSKSHPNSVIIVKDDEDDNEYYEYYETIIQRQEMTMLIHKFLTLVIPKMNLSVKIAMVSVHI